MFPSPPSDRMNEREIDSCSGIFFLRHANTRDHGSCHQLGLSHRAPSLQLLPSSQVARSPQSRLVQPGRPPARQRQLLQPSGLQESPSCLSTPVTLSTPQPSPGCGRFCGRPATNEDTEKTNSALLTMVICSVVVKSSPLQSV